MEPSSTTTTSDLPDRHTRRDIDVHVHLPLRTVIIALLATSLFLVGLSAATKLQSLLLQLMVAIFVAVALDSVVQRLIRKGFSRNQGVLIVMLSMAVAVLAIAAIFVPPIVEQGDKLVQNAPSYVEDVRDNSVYRDIDSRFDVVRKSTEHLEKSISTLPNRIGSIAGSVVGGVFSFLTFLFLVAFLLLGGGDLANGTVRLFPNLRNRVWWTVIQGAYRNIGSYVLGALSIATIAGVTMTIVLFAVGTPFALPLGLWMLLLDLIPLVGASIGAVPAVLVTFITGGLVRGFIVLIFVILYQQIENVIIQPRIQGRVAQLSALVIFLSVLIGSSLLGVIGALFAVPVASIIAIVLRQYMEISGKAETVVPSLHHHEEPPPEGSVTATS